MAVSPTLLFQHLRWRLLHNALTLLLAHSGLRVATIIFCSLLIWGLIFGVSMVGFHELTHRWDIPLHLEPYEFLFALLFFVLTILLTFSTGIILYSSLFGAPESAFLLVSPIPDDHVFAYKFQGAVAFSSWAFVLLASPILLAFGWQAGAPWYFYLAMPLFFLGFVLLPGSLGAVMCLLIVNLMPRQRKQVLILAAIVLLAALLLWTGSWLRSIRTHAVTRQWFEELLAEFSLLRGRLAPFHWVAHGLRAAAFDRFTETAFYLALVWSNGLVAYLLTLRLARTLLRRGFNRVASGGSLRRRYGGHWLDACLDRSVFFLAAQTRLLIVKDFRTFRRDPAQWAQVLIFLALSSFYFAGMRNYYEQDINRNFKNSISLLTLTATAFLMCAYTGRFIFPMLSLEGRKFWILGLLPLERGRLLWGKFAFSALGCVLAGEFLIVFSNLMLTMPWLIVVLHTLTIGVLALGLSGLSVGIGAMIPNFRETDPSKIAVGFGGTLNLIACLLLLLVEIGLMAVPAQMVYAANLGQPLSLADLPFWVWLGFALGLGLGVAAILLPLRMGTRQLKQMEF